MSNSRFTGALPNLSPQSVNLFSATDNFFHTYSSDTEYDVCNGGPDSFHLDGNCFPTTAGSLHCDTLQRSIEVCNATCSTSCPGTDVCYVMDSNTPACPCGATQYASSLNPGSCLELNSEWSLWCMYMWASYQCCMRTKRFVRECYGRPKV